MYLIKNGCVHIGEGTVIENCDVLVEGTKIKKVAQKIECKEAKIIDASGCEVFPGFIDPHTSIGVMGIPTRYLDFEEQTDPFTPEMNIKYSIDPDEMNWQEFYKSGITTIGCTPGNSNIMGGQLAVCKTAPLKMKERVIKEHAGLKCSVDAKVKGVYGDAKRMPMTRMGTFHLLKEKLREARETEEKTKKQQVICEVFDEKKMPVIVAASTKGEIDGFIHLMREESVEKILIDGYEFADCLEGMKKYNIGLILGNVNEYSQIAKHDMKIAKMSELVDNGNLIALTSSCQGFSTGREALIWNAIELYREGIGAEEIIKMLTLNPAKMLGVAGRVGTIEEGKDADICIYTAHPVTSYMANVKHCLINGEVIL